MKFRDAQNNPERALVSVSQCDSALSYALAAGYLHKETLKVDILFLRRRLEPCPKLNTSPALSGSSPGSHTPRFIIPSARAEAKVQFLGMSVLQYLSQRAWKVLEILRFKGRCGGIAAECE